MPSYFSGSVCSVCGETIPRDAARSHDCRDGGVPLARYDLEQARRALARDAIAAGPPSMWRYAPLLPVDRPADAVTLGEGWTPLIDVADLAGRDVLVKDEGRNPSGSFKDRGASVALTRYRELAVRTVILNSSGNAAGAWSLYAARAGLTCVAVIPTDAQPSSVAQCQLAGARVYVLERWHDGGRIVAEAAGRHGWLSVATLKEPLRVEGKKTMGYEIAEQLGWRLPDAIFYPTGGGTGAVAIWKAFEELIALGWVTGKLPRLYVTQYEGCAPIVKAFADGKERCEPWGHIDILPGGLKSPKPAGDRAVLALIRQTGGAALAVSTDETLAAAAELAGRSGVFACPEGATTVAGFRKALAAGLIGPRERVVLVNTGSGLKSVPSFRLSAFPVIHGADDIAAR